jgi:WD40 repeat protein/biotin carboxyl carrier protein
MLRWLAVCIVLAGATFAIVAVIVGPGGVDWTSPGVQAGERQPDPPRGGAGTQPTGEEPGQTQAASTAPDAPLPPAMQFNALGGHLTKMVVIPGGILEIAEQQEVASPAEGIVVFIGTELEPGDPAFPPKPLPRNCLDVWMGFLAVPAAPGEEGFTFRDDPAVIWRHWREGDYLEPKKVRAGLEPKRIRKLQVGDRVKKGQLVALVDPGVAFAELKVQVAKLEASQAEFIAAGKAKETAQKQYDGMARVLPGNPNAFAKFDVDKAKLEAEKGKYDEMVKEASIRSTSAELSKAATTLQMRKIRSKIDGVVKTIYKNPEGDAVKPNEPVVLIQNPDQLHLKSLLEVQEAQPLKKGMEVFVEATRPEPPRAVLSGHLDAVTCVAVSKRPAKDSEPPQLIVSGSEDHTVRLWDTTSGQLRWLQSLRSAVPRALACTPQGSQSNVLLVGDSSGVGRLFNLNDMKSEPLVLDGRHEGAINCVAFSPDGSLCATGGEDMCLCLWKTETGKQLHRLTKAHRGAVTSVQFAGAGRVVSAGRDGMLVVWDFEEGKAPMRAVEFEGRSADVNQLGVSPDGQRVLYDQGRTLRVLSTVNKQSEGVLTNPGSTMNFATMALFSPDGKSILTNGAAAGRLQLWRAPTTQARASELRQFIWSQGVATCGAFSPDGSFAVTGTQDHQVLLWTMPSEKEVEKPLKARLILVEQALETRSRQVRVWAELDNPGWLIPGSPATMVVPPQASPQ